MIHSFANVARSAIRLAALLALAVALMPWLIRPASAACSPSGNAGDVAYSSSQNLMVYCNGTSWVNMGSSSAVSFGTLTAGDFCLATSGTAISCTTATVNLSSQASGTLQAAQEPAHAGDMTNTAGSLATTVGSIGGKAVSLGSALTTSGAYSLTLTTTGATNVTLPTSGTLVTNAVTSLPSLAGVGTITSGVWNGTAITVPYGGTGVTSITAHSVMVGEGTAGILAPVGAAGTVLVGNGSSADPSFSASPSLTSLTLGGIETNTLGADYTTVGTAQSDVALGSYSSVRYAGTAAGGFYGIAAGASGQVLRLHNASAYTLTLYNQNTSDTTAANRIITGTGVDLAMAANSSVMLQYDSTAARWRIIGGSGGGIPAGTTGQVQFNSAGAFGASGNLFWDNTNYRLGIGTATPAYSLDAYTGTVAGTVMHVTPQAVALTTGTATGGVAINSAGIGQMAYYSAASTISGTPNLYVSGSNIGIGTSTPTNLLSLSGAAAQTLWMERGTTIGNNLTVQAGGGLSGGTNEAGGNLILSSGISTGSTGSQIQFKTYAPGSSGTADNTATTAMTIGSTGYVGIGTVSPIAKVEVAGGTAANNTKGIRMTADTLDFRVFAESATIGAGFIGTESNHSLRFYTNGFGNTAMTILSGSNVLVGTTAAVSVEKFNVTYAGNSQFGILLNDTTTSNSANMMVFDRSGTQIGSITEASSSSVSYNTTSDRRLKENIAPTVRGLDDLLKIQSADFNFISDPKKVRVQGYIAQDLYKIYPEAVTVGGDDPKKHPWAVDYGRLTPLIVKAVQELKALLDTDHAMVMQLKADNDNLRALVEQQGRAFDDYRRAHP